MADDVVYTRDGQGNMALRTTSTTGDNSTNPDVAWTRDNNGKACLRVLGGGGGSGEPTVSTITDGGTITLASNTIYTGGEIASFTVAFPATATAAFMAETDFTSGATATTLTYPANIKWSGDDLTSNQFVPKSNKRYNVIWWNDGVNWNAVASVRA